MKTTKACKIYNIHSVFNVKNLRIEKGLGRYGGLWLCWWSQELWHDKQSTFLPKLWLRCSGSRLSVTHTHSDKQPHTDLLTIGLLPLLNIDLSHTYRLWHRFWPASCTAMGVGQVYTERGQMKRVRRPEGQCSQRRGKGEIGKATSANFNKTSCFTGKSSLGLRKCLESKKQKKAVKFSLVPGIPKSFLDSWKSILIWNYC